MWEQDVDQILEMDIFYIKIIFEKNLDLLKNTDKNIYIVKLLNRDK